MKYFLSIALLTLATLATFAPAQAHSNNVLQTSQGPLSLHIIEHASFVMNWQGQTIYVDPVGGADKYQGLGTPDIIFITHAHGDHLDTDTLKGLKTSDTTLVMPQSVADKIDTPLGKSRLILANGEKSKKLGMEIEAVPMYNLPASKDAFHPKGWGNGYVLTLGDKRVYISGDTEGTPEMRALKNIDLAFVCMNLPYTMDVEQAADAVVDFAPGVVYPYHYRGQDTEQFKALVDKGDKGIVVRLVDWYLE